MEAAVKRSAKRTGAREAWYIYYRMLRIVRRESYKVYIDVLIYGSGFTMITNDANYIRHIPIEQVIIKDLK